MLFFQILFPTPHTLERIVRLTHTCLGKARSLAFPFPCETIQPGLHAFVGLLQPLEDVTQNFAGVNRG